MTCEYAKPFPDKYGNKPFRCIYDKFCEHKVNFGGTNYCGEEMTKDPLGELEVIYNKLEKIIEEG